MATEIVPHTSNTNSTLTRLIARVDVTATFVMFQTIILLTFSMTTKTKKIVIEMPGCIFLPACTKGKNVFHFFLLTRSVLRPLQNVIIISSLADNISMLTVDHFHFQIPAYSLEFTEVGSCSFGSEFSPTYTLSRLHSRARTHTHMNTSFYTL
jgi:hypothetical protein